MRTTLALFLAAAWTAQAAHVQFTLGDYTSTPSAVRTLALYPFPNQPGTNGAGQIVTRDRVTRTTDTAGSVTISNVAAGAYYSVLSGATAKTTNYYIIPDTNGVIAADLWIVPGSLQPQVYSYGRSTVDTLIAAATNGLRAATYNAGNLTNFPFHIDVRDYGAKGDGSQDDDVAINSAIQAGLANGKKVLLRAGTYRIANPLIINYSNDQGSFTLEGEGGMSHVIVTQRTASAHGIVITNATSYVTIRNINVLGPGTPTSTGAGIYADGYHNGASSVDCALFENIEVAGFKHGYWLQQVSNSRIRGGGVIGNTVGIEMTNQCNANTIETPIVANWQGAILNPGTMAAQFNSKDWGGAAAWRGYSTSIMQTNQLVLNGSCNASVEGANMEVWAGNAIEIRGDGGVRLTLKNCHIWPAGGGGVLTNFSIAFYDNPGGSTWDSVYLVNSHMSCRRTNETPTGGYIRIASWAYNKVISATDLYQMDVYSGGVFQEMKLSKTTYDPVTVDDVDCKKVTVTSGWEWGAVIVGGDSGLNTLTASTAKRGNFMGYRYESTTADVGYISFYGEDGAHGLTQLQLGFVEGGSISPDYLAFYTAGTHNTAGAVRWTVNPDGTLYAWNGSGIYANTVRGTGFTAGSSAGLTTNVNVLIAGNTTNQLQFTGGILTGVVPIGE